ncbi:kinase-like protein [Aureobasidium pullulans]|nr:kinase-like protein [Aureobasidium pullulans]THX63930.1 kinase-like protein [Aureobasidium pullulans]
MTLHNAASDISLEDFLTSGQRFHWVQEDGHQGPAVQMDYQPISEDIGIRFGTLVEWTAKSHIVIVPLITDDGRQDRVAAKIMRTPSNILKLRNELEILRGLRHKHIIAVLGSFSRSGRKNRLEYGVLVFPLATQDLGDFLERISKHNKDFEETRSAWIAHEDTPKLLPFFACLCRAVLYLHEKCVKHRDIKPENILIDRAHNAILADFDISRAYNDVKEAITYSSLDGTIMYSSKHVWKGPDNANPKDRERGLEWDIISLGFVFLEMATVIFGKDLRKMRENMHYRHNHETMVIYSEALRDGKIQEWVEVLRATATGSPEKLPDQLREVIKSVPDYVNQFLGAIMDMMSAEQDNHHPLRDAYRVFGCLSNHCPCPQPG